MSPSSPTQSHPDTVHRLSRSTRFLIPARIHVTLIPRISMSKFQLPEEVDGGYVSTEDGCRTPKQSGCRIPATCPPAPRKKQAYLKQRSPPENGYFQPPDLEILFAMPPTPIREACI
ncbi:unnamed protein product [Lactuca virosa]|uniref:Cyclin-dependent protein kinase inhibitor SMR4 n=1 Tax=Lactuca virosa TaxID=75947 RepID=A0AAU9MRV6_9ASTR|nr:unnamed protein product [Lactuca virosa]